MLVENRDKIFEREEAENEEIPIGKIIRIDNDDEIVMNLIDDNIDILVNHTDHYYGNTHNTLKSIENRSVKGYILLGYDYNKKYYIRGIILYRHEMIPGSASIILLYGESVKLRENLIIKVMDYLKDNSFHSKLIVYANSFDPEDSDVYMYLGYRFYDAKMSEDGGVAYVSYYYNTKI